MGGVLEFVDVIKLRVEASGREDLPSYLLWRRIRNAQTRCVCECQNNRRRQVDVDSSRQFDAANKQVVSAKSKVLCQQVFRSRASLLAIRGGHAWIGTE